MFDVIILGKGPAGIQASLYVKRAGLNVLVLAKDGGALMKTESIANYYGTGTLSGPELLNAGIQQATDLGIEIRDAEVTSISMEFDGSFLVDTMTDSLRCHAVIIATGSPRTTVKIPNLKELEGKGVSYCAVCDAFFYRKKTVAVIGQGAYALHEAQELLPLVQKVILLTHGLPVEVDFPDNVEINTAKIERILGTDHVEGVLLADRSEIKLDGVFVALGSASSFDLALKIGAQVEGNKILTDDNRQTNVPGLFAAGDCTTGTMQIAKAVGDGMVAGLSVVSYIRTKKLTMK